MTASDMFRIDLSQQWEVIQGLRLVALGILILVVAAQSRRSTTSAATRRSHALPHAVLVATGITLAVAGSAQFASALSGLVIE